MCGNVVTAKQKKIKQEKKRAGKEQQSVCERRKSLVLGLCVTLHYSPDFSSLF